MKPYHHPPVVHWTIEGLRLNPAPQSPVVHLLCNLLWAERIRWRNDLTKLNCKLTMSFVTPLNSHAVAFSHLWGFFWVQSSGFKPETIQLWRLCAHGTALVMICWSSATLTRHAHARGMRQLELLMPKFSAPWVFVLTFQQLQAHIHWCTWQLKLVYHRFMRTFRDTFGCARRYNSSQHV